MTKTPRPRSMAGVTIKYEAGCVGEGFAILNCATSGDLKEIFIKQDKQGSCSAAIMNALAIVLSVSMRSGVPAAAFSQILRTASCPHAPCCLASLGGIIEELDNKGDIPEPIPRPTRLRGETAVRKTGCGNISVTCNDENDQLREVIVNIGAPGSCANAVGHVIGRITTEAISHGVEVEDIIGGLSGISCPNSNGACTSCLDAVSRVLEAHQEDLAPVEVDHGN